VTRRFPLPDESVSAYHCEHIRNPVFVVKRAFRECSHVLSGTRAGRRLESIGLVWHRASQSKRAPHQGVQLRQRPPGSCADPP
jgi:hypothetical protein